VTQRALSLFKVVFEKHNRNCVLKFNAVSGTGHKLQLEPFLVALLPRMPSRGGCYAHPPLHMMTGLVATQRIQRGARAVAAAACGRRRGNLALMGGGGEWMIAVMEAQGCALG
jgi:hypothetical protein